MKLYLYLKNGIPEIEASETPVPGFDLYELRKADETPACHGLDLPPGIPAGAVSRLVGLLAEASVQLDQLTGANLEAYARTFAALAGRHVAPFTADPAPVSPPEEPEPVNLPAGFQKLATSPSLEGIRKHVAAFYGGETKEFRMHPGGYSVHKADGTRLSPQVIRTRRGYYFGTV